MTEIDRWLEFEGVDNIRDVGGLPLRSGGSIRPGLLLRSASLHNVTPADVEFLVQRFGLRLVLDLRSPTEIDRDGPTAVSAAGVETVALNFIGDNRVDFLPEGDVDIDPMLRIYRGYLADQSANVVAAVRRLAAQDAGPSLVHCQAGKDRTGTLVALVLDAVGVERTAVIADFVLSAERIEAMFRRWTTASGEPMPTNLDRHKPRRAVMETLLAELDEKYGTNGVGGAAGWLTANGLKPDELDHLTTRLTG